MNKNYQHIYQTYRKCNCIVATNITKTQQEKLDTLFESEGLHILIMNVEAFSTD